jgi:Flp pilus assembly pilin Flp
VILVIVIGTVRLIGGNANNVFNQVSNQMGQ